MKLFSSKTLLLILILLLSTTFFNTAFAQDQDKPMLSEAIREAIDSQGIEAAKKKFADMDKSQREQFNIDMEGISELTNHYVQAGDFEAITAISEISAPFMQDMASKAMDQYSSEMAEMMTEQQQAEKEQQEMEREEERERHRQEQAVERQAQPRDDLQRFTGLYADPEAGDSPRQLWVQASCEGTLVSGAMWGDASPWWLRSESDNVFASQSSFNSIRMEFSTGPGGNAVEMIHDLEFMKSPLKRVGPLPDDWDSCLERNR